jgi:hypothetical protein
MAKLSRGFIPKCPRFAPSRSDGDNAEHCIVKRDGKRLEIVRYRRTGKLVAWMLPSRGPIRGGRIPLHTPTTRSLDHVVTEALSWIRRVDKPRA